MLLKRKNAKNRKFFSVASRLKGTKQSFGAEDKQFWRAELCDTGGTA